MCTLSLSLLFLPYCTSPPFTHFAWQQWQTSNHTQRSKPLSTHSSLSLVCVSLSLSSFPFFLSDRLFFPFRCFPLPTPSCYFSLFPLLSPITVVAPLLSLSRPIPPRSSISYGKGALRVLLRFSVCCRCCCSCRVSSTFSAKVFCFVSVV